MQFNLEKWILLPIVLIIVLLKYFLNINFQYVTCHGKQGNKTHGKDGVLFYIQQYAL